MVKVEIKSFNFDLRIKNAHGDIFHHKKCREENNAGNDFSGRYGKTAEGTDKGQYEMYVEGEWRNADRVNAPPDGQAIFVKDCDCCRI